GELWQLCFLARNLFTLLGRVRMQKLLNDATLKDIMTGSLSMTGLMRHAGMLYAKQELSRFVGIFFNIKNFKYINQSAGGRKGDEILVTYSHTLLSYLQEEECICRPGGDNFFALVLKENADDYLALLQEVPVKVRNGSEEMTFLISTTAGVYDVRPGDDIGKVMNCATIALNVAKHSDQVVEQLWYHPSMQEKIMREKQISQLFPHALRSQEFLVYYQPKVSLSTGKLCGCEALVRWRHDGRLVPPMEFVPVLEKEGTICSLDFYVFDRVCSDIRNWLDKGIELVRVSVNFSQHHLRSLDLAERIEAIMEYYRIDSSLIEIELTELSGVKNHDSMMAFLKKMHNKGICTSIDDFGTGYSSLSMLREFDMDIIKIDKSFLDRIAVNDENCRPDEIVIENIVRMAQSLDLGIISEGVERKEQAEFLRQIHCDMAQGFLFDKPLPHDVFEERLTGSRDYPLPEEV
ncbi:MAG: EAL domain-containing protein, partial [Oscillospiraceae bacterium]|nr:EAL domain-containing protein [Oscillospiraceae bacterium]